MQTTLDALQLAGVLDLRNIDGELCLVIPIAPLPLDALPHATRKLGGVQAQVFHVVNDLAAFSDDGRVSVDDIYDDMHVKLAKPADGKRDRRVEVARRALQTLHEKGWLTIRDDTVTVGAESQPGAGDL